MSSTSSSIDYESLNSSVDNMTGQEEGMIELKQAPGAGPAQAKEELASVLSQLTFARRRFSTRFGQPGAAYKQIPEIEQNLARDNVTYLKLASAQADLCEADLIQAEQDQARLLDESVTLIEAIDPKFEVNTREEIKQSVELYTGDKRCTRTASRS